MPVILSVKNLTKKFNGFAAINGISFDASEGEILGLLGPNGAGKTTTIGTIATLQAPTSGTTEVCGFDVIKNPEEVRKNIGVLTTDIGVYERFTGRENLRYFGELYKIYNAALENRINDLVKLLQMEDFIDRISGKYSTGMKQKLAIARSVIHDPKVIMFDEPTAGLDVLAAQTVLGFMRQASKDGKCIIFSTHRMNEAEKLCDRAVIIHRGKMIASDSISALKEKTRMPDLEEAFLKLISAEPLVQDIKIGKPYKF